MSVDELIDDPLSTSADTWRTDPPEPRVPPLLLRRRSGIGPRLADWHARHALRRAHAAEVYRASRNPERGLPVADGQEVVGFLRQLIGTRWGGIILLILTNVLAAAAGLVAPRVLGDVVNLAATPGKLASSLTSMVVVVTVVVVAQGVLTFAGRLMSTVVGQDLLAQAREFVVRAVLRLPLSRVEQASSGDLITRVTRDVSSMSNAVRWALPQLVIASIMTVLTLVAMLLNSWLLTLPTIAALGLLFVSVHHYLRFAPMGYITEGSAYSTINTTFTETMEGARTVEALGLGELRTRRSIEDLEVAGQAERYTMSIRNIMFTMMDFSYRAPLVFIILLGAWGHSNGWVSLGQVTAAALYVQQMIEPMDQVVSTLDTLQVGAASATRLLGIATVPPDREASEVEPADTRLEGRDLRFAYREGHDVLHGVDLRLVPGERLAIVGPSGSGKSTLSRLLAGINGPRTGVVEVGGTDVMGLPVERLRTEVALVTQEHHVFVGSVRDNVVLAREDTATDPEVWEALGVVEAREWVERLPDGLSTRVGSGHLALTPGQAQQIALARLVIADPHTLVLDEATSLIDPTTARHLEGSMASLLTGRTVVAIAHRLHTAHDADRIAVVMDGRIAELGSHDELLARDGAYAALWRAWKS